MKYLEAYNQWLNDPLLDPETRSELAQLSGNDAEIQDRFFTDLEFGTGGLRGILGAGTNRMNIYTVRKATQGLANYILMQDAKAKSMGVAIAYDSRRLSKEFAMETALVLNGNGIKTYLFKELRPTPMLSFAVRYLGCVSGVVITASHNPKEYNGYKAYWADGGQVTSPRDVEIIDEVNKITDFSQIKVAQKEEAEKAGLFNLIEEETDQAFYKEVLALSVNKNLPGAKDICIVYTPFNGAGNTPVREVLKAAGFTNVHTVKEQTEPDPDFTTIGYPNPESRDAFALALKLAKEVNADIILATDPDADRVGAVVKHNNEYIFLTGNMVGQLLTEYILAGRSAGGNLPENAMVISTIVSTRLTSKIAENYKVSYMDVLTGFKHIAAQILQSELSGAEKFVFGFEESIGYLAGTHCRDKDAVSATMLICEMAAQLKSRNMTLIDALNELYSKYGYSKEYTESITLKGLEGLSNIKKIMATLRENPPTEINGSKVSVMRDYSTSKEYNKLSGTEAEINLPKSDVLYYLLEDQSWVCVRPSGTEPKIKVYFGVCTKNEEEANQLMQALTADMLKLIDNSYN